MPEERPNLRLLRAIVFTVGVSTLGAEIAAARLMAPFFGASTIVWANTIATVLVALSIGYWLGGRLADKRPHLIQLARWVLFASVLLALVPLVAPTTPEDRLAAIGARARGFVYTVSVTGTTGERGAAAAGTPCAAGRARRARRRRAYRLP